MAWKRTYAALAGVAVLVLAAGCGGQYASDLWHIAQEGRSRIQVEQTAFAARTRLNVPYATVPVVAGDRNTVVILLGMRQPMGRESAGDLGLKFDEYRKYWIYLELPEEVRAYPDTVHLPSRAYVRLMQHYELSPAEKLYLPEGNGMFVIDSVKSKHMFGTFSDTYWRTESGARIGLDGRVVFKVK